MYCAHLIALSLALVINIVSGHGKDPGAPHLSPSVLAALKPTERPHMMEAPKSVTACLPDYELIDNMCVKEIVQPARLACLGGHLVDGRCQIALPHLLSCPPGYKMEDDKCTRIVETNIQFYCPKGFYDDGTTCAQSVVADLVLQCDLGELVGEQCVIRDHQDYIIKAQCPEGTELLEDGNCWRDVETFDCSEDQHDGSVTVVGPAPKTHTPVGKKVTVQKGKVTGGTRGRNLAGKEQDMVRGTLPPPPPPKKVMAHGKELVAVTAPHATRVQVVSQICSKKVQVDALALVICPPDYVDTQGHCLKETYRPPVPICSSGTMHNGVCQPSIKRVPKHPGCPQGGYSAEGKCWIQEFEDAMLTCPPHFTNSGDECIGFRDEVEYECPLGFELVTEECYGRLERPPFTFGPESLGYSSKNY